MAASTELAARVRSGAPEARLEALLEAMQEVAPDEALVAAVVATLDDDHPGLRQAALESVGRFATFAAIDFSLEVLERAVALTRDEHARVRAEAAATLAQLRDDEEHAARIFALRRMLADEEPGVRQEAAAALGDLFDHESADALAALLEDGDKGVRFEAAFALAALKDPRALPSLVAALERTRIRLDAMKALGLLGDAAAIGPLERLASKLFLGWADRLTANATLYLLGRRDASKVILKSTSARNFQERTYAIALIGTHKIVEGGDTLARIAEDPKHSARDAAVRALGELGDRSRAAVLERIARDETGPLREDAAAALEKLRRLPRDRASTTLPS